MRIPHQWPKSARLLCALTRALAATLRYQIDDPHRLLTDRPGPPVIFAFWHNRMLLVPYVAGRVWIPRGRRVAVLVSRSRDGHGLADILAAYGLRVVRGSTKKGGGEALRELVRAVKDGFDIGITPDGPRGPRYVVQPGCVALAQLTGARLIPLSYDLSRQYTVARSWDGFLVPWPFARCTVRLGAPMLVPREADAGVSEAKRRDLEQVLRTMAASARVRTV
jgi:lysophospholipid acyltransferase (LPLAT)-like uncharacterized protein